MLKFDGVVFPEHKVNQDADDRAVFSKKAGSLIDAQRSRTRRERNEIGIARKTIEFFRQNNLDVPEVAQSLERVIEPFTVDESFRRGHLLSAQTQLRCYPQCIFENFALGMIFLRRGRWNPFATINERGGISHQLFDPEQRIARHHPGREPEALIDGKCINCSLNFSQAHRVEFTALEAGRQGGPDS